MSEAYAEALAMAPVDDPVMHTIELLHSAFVDDDGDPTALRVVRDHANLTARLEADAPRNAGEEVLFVGLPFEFTLPGEDNSNAAPSLNLAIDNVSREVARQMRKAAGTLDVVELIYRPYVLSDLSAPHINPPIRMVLSNIKATLTRVTGTASFGGGANRRFPSMDYTREQFPGLAAR